MNMAPRYLLTDRFDLGMLSNLTADISLTEISLEDVCELIEVAEKEMALGMHGGWADGIRSQTNFQISAHGPILLVARPVLAELGAVVKWVRVEIVD